MLEQIPTTVCKFTWKGRPSWLYSDGTILPVISGGDGDPDPKDPPDPKNDPDPNGDGDKKFTQADLNRLLAREKSEGKRVATAEVLQALGVKDMDEVKTMIQSMKDAEAANLSDAEKAKREAESAKLKAEKDSADAAKERRLARIERALLKAGAPDEHIDRISKLVDVEDDADADKVKEAVEALKEEMPQLFDAPVDPKTPDPKPPGSNPGRPPRTGGAPNPTPSEAARSVLAARHPGKVKTS